MAVTFLEPGTDATQDFSLFAGTLTATGTITSDTTQVHTGPRSIKSDVTSTNGGAICYTANAVVADTGGVMSCWVRFNSVGPSIVTGFLSANQATNGIACVGVGLNTNGTLQVKGRGATGVNGTTVLLVNTWYRISFGYVITSSTNWSAVVYINGVSEATTSNTQGTLTAVTTSCAVFGLNNPSLFNSTSSILTMWVDDIYVNNATNKADPGNISITNKRPNANGTTNGFTTQVGSGGSGYGTGHSPQVNEQPLSTTNGWSIAAASAITEEYNIESAATGDVNISTATLVDYMGWLYTKAVLSETAQIIVNNVATNIAIPTNANTMFTQIAGSTTYPAATGTDIGEITATTVTTVSLFECGIIFAYIAATGTNLLMLLGAGT